MKMVSSDEEADHLLLRRRMKPRETLITSPKLTQKSLTAKRVKTFIKPTTLLEKSLQVFLKETHIALFEVQVVQKCPKSLYPKLLACCLLLPQPRNFVIRVLLRHWPVQVLCLEDLKMCYPEFSLLFTEEPIGFYEVNNNMKKNNKVFEQIHYDGSQIEMRRYENEIFLDRVLLLLLENFISSIGFANHRMRLKVIIDQPIPFVFLNKDLLYVFLFHELVLGLPILTMVNITASNPTKISQKTRGFDLRLVCDGAQM